MRAQYTSLRMFLNVAPSVWWVQSLGNYASRVTCRDRQQGVPMQRVYPIMIAAFLVGCSSNNQEEATMRDLAVPPESDAGSSDSGSSTGPVAGVDARVTVFDHTAVYFTGSDNRRTVDAP